MNKRTLLLVWLPLLAIYAWAQTSNIPTDAALTGSAEVATNADTITLSDSVTVSIHPNKQNLENILLLSEAAQTATIGVSIYDADADTLVYAYNAHKLMHPASTMKLFSAITALRFLGGSYAIRTEVYQAGLDLYIKGNMDPAFSTADLKSLVAQVNKHCIRNVNTIYCDLTLKDMERKGSGWCWDDTGGDSPILTPLILNRDSFFVEAFKKQLTETGISVGRISRVQAKVPTSATLIAVVSRTIDDILPFCLKQSDNLYAEAILYQLNRLYGKPYLSARNGALEKVDEMLAEAGVSAKYRIVDGSGLSYYNLVSADMETAILRYAYAHPDLYSSLSRALPIGGRDGTLRSRLGDYDIAGRVVAKTGSISGVVALVGYVSTKSGKTYIFSFISNGVAPAETRLQRELQDNLLTELIRRW